MISKENTTKYSLRTWVLMLALAPTILIGILLGCYFTFSRFNELEQSLIERGTNIIEPLAISAEIALETKNLDTTKRLLTSVQQTKSNLIQFIAIFDNDNNLIVASHNYKNHEFMSYNKHKGTLSKTESEQFNNKLVLRTPIFANQEDFLNLPYRINTTKKPSNAVKIGYISILINKENASLEQHRSAITAFIMVLIGVQLNLLFTFRLVKNVTQPITEMVRVVAKIREGRLDTRMDGNLIGELDLLKRGINAMASSLFDYHEEMQQNIDQATSDLRETLEQIKIQNVELDLVKKRALEASQIKSEFLANMSHELRTPLNGVIGFAKQLLKTPLHSSQQDYIKTIEKSATNLLGIINNILDISKLEAGKVALENMPFSLREVIEDSISLLANSAREKSLELVIDIEPSIDDDISGDALRVSQVITNLVNNAIKFTDKGIVHVKLRLIDKNKDSINIRGEITDTGIGIDKHLQGQLFKAFGQADSSISRRFGGTGLGLVITQRLINSLGGQIGCTSSANKGSTFWFTLPLKLAEYPVNKPFDTQKLMHKSILLFEPRELSRVVYENLFYHWQMDVTSITDLDKLNWITCQSTQHYDYVMISCNELTDNTFLVETLKNIKQITDYSVYFCHTNHPTKMHLIQANVNKVVQAPIGEHALAKTLISAQEPQDNPLSFYEVSNKPSREPLSVLAVDDNPANLKLMDTLLRELVNQVTVADNGQSAVNICKIKSFDLIFMDIQMPETDGFSATKQIREDSLNRNTPIIAVTAHALTEERQRIDQSGMNGYLPKPIDEAALKDVIDRWKTRPKFTHFDPYTLNWDLCLTQANQKADIALEMLQMLIDSLPETRIKLLTSLENLDPKAMINHVHKLHGASCYCGVPTTQRLCREIETSLKKHGNIKEIEPEILELLDELSKVHSAANQLISQLSMGEIDA